MYNVCYDITAVGTDYPDDMLIALNQAAVDGLAAVNKVILQYYHVPALYDFAPRYHIPREVQTGRARERWKDIGAVLRDRWGDCKDFTAWRLAELWKRGVSASAESIVHREGRRLVFHTYVRYSDGRYEDPAKRLGMP